MPRWLQELDAAVAPHLARFAKEHPCSEVAVEESDWGAVRGYRCGPLLLRVVNERGILSVEVGKDGEPPSLRGVSQWKDLLDPPANGRWNLSLEESFDFLARNWETLAS